MPPYSERKKSFLGFVSDEAEAYRLGLVSDFTSIDELAGKFEYRKGTIREYLRTSGLLGIRTELSNQKKVENLVPSRDYAWMIGIISGGGSASSRSSSIALASADPELLTEFASTGGNLFKEDPTYSHQSIQADGRDYRKVSFCNRVVAGELGDLRRERWPETIRSDHSWILKERNYIWDFLEGFAEVRCRVEYGSRIRISIGTSYVAVADSLFDMLHRVGVQTASLKRDRSAREGIKGIEITHMSDMKHIANNIDSSIPSKQEKLDLIKKHELPEYATVDELVADWAKVKEEFGSNPTSRNIIHLHRSGVIKWGLTPYLRLFSDGRSFNLARENIEKFIDHEPIGEDFCLEYDNKEQF